MRRVRKLAIAALALVGVWKVASWMCKGTAWLLVKYGSWDFQTASKAAPWIILALISSLVISLSGLLDDNQRYKRSSPYGRAPHSESRNDSSRKAG